MLTVGLMPNPAALLVSYAGVVGSTSLLWTTTCSRNFLYIWTSVGLTVISKLFHCSFPQRVELRSMVWRFHLACLNFTQDLLGGERLFKDGVLAGFVVGTGTLNGRLYLTSYRLVFKFDVPLVLCFSTH